MAKKLSKEERAAMQVQAMLQGISLDEMLERVELEDEPDDIEIVIEDEKKGKKKAKRKTAKEEKIGSENQVFTTKQSYVPEEECFKRVNRDLHMNVTYDKHDIPYKEQFWPVPERTVEYHLEMINMPKKAKDISDLMNKGSAEERKLAEDGKVRYMMLVNHDENVSHKIREIAYVRVAENNGKLTSSMIVNSRCIKESHGNPERVKKNLKRLLGNIAVR